MTAHDRNMALRENVHMRHMAGCMVNLRLRCESLVLFIHVFVSAAILASVETSLGPIHLTALMSTHILLLVLPVRACVSWPTTILTSMLAPTMAGNVSLFMASGMASGNISIADTDDTVIPNLNLCRASHGLLGLVLFSIAASIWLSQWHCERRSRLGFVQVGPPSRVIPSQGREWRGG